MMQTCLQCDNGATMSFAPPQMNKDDLFREQFPR